MSHPINNQLKVLFEREEIAKAVAGVVAETKQYYQRKRLLLIGVLKGSFIFMAGLVCQLDMNVKTDFVKILCYYCPSLFDKDLAKGMEKNI